MNSPYINHEKGITKTNLSTQSTYSPRGDKNTVTTWKKWLLRNLTITLFLLTVVVLYSYSSSDKPLTVTSFKPIQPANCSTQTNRTGYAIQCTTTEK